MLRALASEMRCTIIDTLLGFDYFSLQTKKEGKDEDNIEATL